MEPASFVCFVEGDVETPVGALLFRLHWLGRRDRGGSHSRPSDGDHIFPWCEMTFIPYSICSGTLKRVDCRGGGASSRA